MPTTEFIDEENISIYAIASRTDDSSTELDDLSAEEARSVLEMFTEGYVGNEDAFKVTHTSGLNIEIGSGNARSDLYIVPSTNSGQGKYLVRLEQGVISATLDAAHSSNNRIDEIYVVVTDSNYEGGTLTLPRLAYRKGNPGEGAPGPQGTWSAYALLGTAPVNASASSPGSISDNRVRASIREGIGGTIPLGGIIKWSGSIANIPAGWALCNGSGGTPDMRNRFVVGAGSTYSVGATGGANTVTLTTSQIPSHDHNDPSHSHHGGSYSATSSGSSHEHTQLMFLGGGLGRLTMHSGSNESTVSGSLRLALERDIRVNRRGTGGLNEHGGRAELMGVTGHGSGHTHNVSGNSGSNSGGRTGNTGGSNSHENRPPYYALAYIMRVQ